MKINELIDKAKEKADIKSDYALAKVLGVKTGHVSGWRAEKRHPSNEEAVKLATLAGLDEMRVIAEIEMRTANSPKKKEFWKHYIESKGITASIMMTIIATGIVLTPEPATASVLQLQHYDGNFHAQNTDALYIMRRKGVLKVLLQQINT